jgi:hypothetical protein
MSLQVIGIMIVKCSNEQLWYNNLEGHPLYEIVHETEHAYWVKREDNKNAWVYKTDCIPIVDTKGESH